jgi:hypothetical protein
MAKYITPEGELRIITAKGSRRYPNVRGIAKPVKDRPIKPKK